MNEPCKIINLSDFYTLMAAANFAESIGNKGTANILRDICDRATNLTTFAADECEIKLPKKTYPALKYHRDYYKGGDA